MKLNHIVLFSATGVDFEQVRKDGRKLAKMFLDAELEEDPAKQESMLLEAEKFSVQIEKKYSGLDDQTVEKIHDILDEEADKASRMYFDSLEEDDDEDD